MTKTTTKQEPKTLSTKQREALIELLWDSLSRSSEHSDRVMLGGGHLTKTKTGLLATIERIVFDEDSL